MTLLQILGLFLFIDDTVIRYRDFLKFDRVHHWQIGAALIILGV